MQSVKIYLIIIINLNILNLINKNLKLINQLNIHTDQLHI
jgi:hypothetical protein